MHRHALLTLGWKPCQVSRALNYTAVQSNLQKYVHQVQTRIVGHKGNVSRHPRESSLLICVNPYMCKRALAIAGLARKLLELDLDIVAPGLYC